MDRVPSFDAIEYLVWRKFGIRDRVRLLMYPSRLLGYRGLPNETLVAVYRSELAQKTPAEIHELACAGEKEGARRTRRTRQRSFLQSAERKS